MSPRTSSARRTPRKLPRASIAVIGGSGLYQMEGLRDVREVRVKTPFGDPSDAIVIGSLQGVRVAFLPRHGRGHRLLPSELPNRANLYALKSLGVERIIAVSACGSLRQEIRPLDLVIPDQLIDRTHGRASTFFGDGIVVHIAFDQPFCPDLSGWLYEAARSLGLTAHWGGSYVCMQGPQFSSVAESQMHRNWGAAMIGMTALPEAKLAREGEMCYAMLANITDYDVWNKTERPVSQELVVENLRKNVGAAQQVLKAVLPRIASQRPCVCATALRGAIATQIDLVPKASRRRLALLLDKHLK